MATSIDQLVDQSGRFDNHAEAFHEGLGYRPMTEFRYVGGDHDSHANYWKLIFPDSPYPPHADFCICGHQIAHNCYIEHIEDEEVLIVGSCCIKKFMDKPGRTCEICRAPHKNRRDNYCNDCRVEHKIVTDNTIIKFGKYKGKTWTFGDVLTKDPPYCQWVMTQDIQDGKIVEFRDWLIGKGLVLDIKPNPTGDQLVGFGKYSTLTYDQVYQSNPQFCKWVLQTPSKMPAFNGLKRWLRNK